MWPIAFTIALVLLLLAAGVCIWLLATHRALTAERDRLAGELRDRETAIEGYLGEIERLNETTNTKDRELVELRTKYSGLDDKFKSLAQEVLANVNAQFQQWAQKTFQGEQEKAASELTLRKQAIEALVKPVHEALDKHAKAVNEIEKSREGAYHGLRQQITSMLETQQQLRTETHNLSTALRRSDVRGRWGEMQLKRIAELAGMIPYCDFDEQVTVRSAEGLQKPDMVVHLPAGRNIIVDSKTPMVAFLDAIGTNDEAERTHHYQRHLEHIQQKVKELSSKRYQDQFERTPDFVILFIPGESFLAPAVQLNPELIEKAMMAGIVIATPTTLISLLKAVEMGWREQRVAENAQKISDLGRELHSRLATAFGHVAALGKSITTTVSNFNKLVGSVETSVLPQARRFQELGADSPKEIPPQLDQVETLPREPAKVQAPPGDATDI